jgi:hypothetical protein
VQGDQMVRYNNTPTVVVLVPLRGRPLISVAPFLAKAKAGSRFRVVTRRSARHGKRLVRGRCWRKRV